MRSGSTGLDVVQDSILTVLEGFLRLEIDLGEMAAAEAAIQRGILVST
jgi:hypothetical protein